MPATWRRTRGTARRRLANVRRRNPPRRRPRRRRPRRRVRPREPFKAPAPKVAARRPRRSPRRRRPSISAASRARCKRRSPTPPRRRAPNKRHLISRQRTAPPRRASTPRSRPSTPPPTRSGAAPEAASKTAASFVAALQGAAAAVAKAPDQAKEALDATTAAVEATAESIAALPDNVKSTADSVGSAVTGTVDAVAAIPENVKNTADGVASTVKSTADAVGIHPGYRQIDGGGRGRAVPEKIGNAVDSAVATAEAVAAVPGKMFDGVAGFSAWLQSVLPKGPPQLRPPPEQLRSAQPTKEEVGPADGASKGGAGRGTTKGITAPVIDVEAYVPAGASEEDRSAWRRRSASRRRSRRLRRTWTGSRPRPFSSVRPGCVKSFCEISSLLSSSRFCAISALCHGRGDGVLVGGLSVQVFFACDAAREERVPNFLASTVNQLSVRRDDFLRQRRETRTISSSRLPKREMIVTVGRAISAVAFDR